MQTSRRSAFTALRERAWCVIDAWAATCLDETLPPIHDLARTYGVRAIRFEPLLSTAGLSKVSDGFLVHVNSDAYDDKPEGTVLDVNEETLWNLRPPVRFSVAHEIAHAIFHTEAQQAGKASALSKRLAALETACNQIAGAMLLPKPALLRNVGNRLFDADFVRGLLASFRVSAQVLIIRLQSDDLASSFSDLEGALVLLRARGNEVRIEAAHARGALAVSRWGKLVRDRKNSSLGDLHLRPEIIERILSAEQLRESQNIVWHPGATQTIPCELITRRVSRDPPAVLIGLRILGSPSFELEKSEASKSDARSNNHAASQ